MPLPSTGYATAVVTNPTSSLTDFSLMIDLAEMPAEWWALVDTSDGTKGRAAKNDGTELATDWIDFDDGAETGWVRVLWSGTLANSGTQTIRIYPPVASNSSNAAGDTYGSNNAYDSAWEGYWPDGGSDDRTASNINGTAQGGVSHGAAAGQVGAGTDYDGFNDYSSLSDGDAFNLTGDLTILAWAEQQTVQRGGIFNRLQSGSPFAGYTFLFGGSGLTGDKLGYFSIATGWKGSTSGVSGMSHVGVRVDADVGGAFWTDGATNGTWSDTSSGPSSWSSGSPTIGRDYIPLYCAGILNEVQLHSAARPDAWIGEEFDQTDDNAAFWGTWTWNPPSAAGSPWYYLAQC